MKTAFLFLHSYLSGLLRMVNAQLMKVTEAVAILFLDLYPREESIVLSVVVIDKGAPKNVLCQDIVLEQICILLVVL